MRCLLPICLLIFSQAAMAQVQENIQSNDSLPVQDLEEVIVKGYEYNLRLMEVPAAINLITKAQLGRFQNTSILPSINQTPGVRMEERSPGSYRLNIRGSSLRSPFGVRNVKVYWDGIPFTDPGGNTYLNGLSFHNFHSIEIIKGPAGSLYGSGTGGVLLIQSQPEQWKSGFDAEYIYGSFNLNSFHTQIKLGKEDRRNILNYSRQSSNGYRDHTNMRRNVATWQTSISANEKQQLSAAVFYSDLYYQTPGALTKAEFDKNPKSARPAAGAFPSAQQINASIDQQTFLAGVTNKYFFNSNFQNTTTVYGAYSGIKNSTFRNYERRTEPHFGGRSVFSWDHSLNNNTELHLVIGGEGQKGAFTTKTFKNRNGNPDTVLTDDAIDNWMYTVFAQGNLHFPQDWIITAGMSLNRSSIKINRLSVPSSIPQERIYSNEWAPRIAVSKKIFQPLMLYASVSQGFSPPTVQEVLPSTSVISTNLNAEHGINYEGGFKSSWLQQRLYVEVNAFYFRLKNTIVQRRDNSGGDYFINAGTTRQKGIESQISYRLLPHTSNFFTLAKVWISHTYNHFKYKDFKQINTDFSGKRLPSVAPHTITAGFDLATTSGLYANLSHFYSDPIALNDANTVYANSYQLLSGRLGWKSKVFKTLNVDVFSGVDNLLNKQYSLGNDINAAGGRYYNVAPGINYFVGIALNVPNH